MPSTFSPSLKLELIGPGEQSGIWGTTTNNNLGSLLEQAITGTTSVDVTSGDVVLTSLNGLVDQSRSATLYVSGTPGVTRVITIPNVFKNYTVQNVTANIVQIKTLSGSPYDCPPLSQSYINCNASNVIVGRSITNTANTLTSSSNLGATAPSVGLAPLASPALTGVPTAPTAAQGTNTTQLATTAFVTTAVAAGIPVGVITMWSGSIASIPAGWALCNGASGTPDLRDRFVVGAGSTYAVGNTGGANTVTLDTTQIPSHTHTGSGTTASTNIDHTHSGTTGATDLSHSHTGSGTTSGQSANHTHSGTSDINNVDHSHGGSGTTSGFSNDHTHSGTTGGENVGHTHYVGGNTGAQSADHSHSYSGTTSGVGDHAHSYTITAGSGTIPNNSIEGGLATFSTSTGAAGAHSHTFSGGTSGVSANHTHFFEVNSGGISNGHVHAFSTGGQSANHTHTYSFTTGGQSANHVHTFSTGANSVDHTHTYSFTTSTFAGNHTHPFTTGAMSANAAHTHTFSFTTGGTGGGAAHENRPPYYALAYIMKI